MELDLPENATVVGRIEIAVLIKDGGDRGTAYGFDGLNSIETIGYLTAVLDRMREREKFSWDTCVYCDRPLDEHDLDEDEEDDDREDTQ